MVQDISLVIHLLVCPVYFHKKQYSISVFTKSAIAIMAIKTKVLRVSMYLRKKEGLSQEEFNRYWSEVHGPLVRPLVQKYNILKYTQVSAAYIPGASPVVASH